MAFPVFPVQAEDIPEDLTDLIFQKIFRLPRNFYMQAHNDPLPRQRERVG
jgi:hypothetical protein